MLAKKLLKDIFCGTPCIIERDAHVSLLRCIYRPREDKEEGKGDQGCSKTLVRLTAWETER